MLAASSYLVGAQPPMSRVRPLLRTRQLPPFKTGAMVTCKATWAIRWRTARKPGQRASGRQRVKASQVESVWVGGEEYYPNPNPNPNPNPVAYASNALSKITNYSGRISGKTNLALRNCISIWNQECMVEQKLLPQNNTVTLQKQPL